MIIQRNYLPYVVSSEEPLSVALQKINANQKGIVFAVADMGTLQGVLTDGDVRRWLLGAASADLDTRISEAMNRTMVSASIEEDPDSIARLLGKRVSAVPLVDSYNRVVAIAFNEQTAIRIGSHEISDDKPSFIIAEIGNNHNGSLEQAFILIDLAAKAGADCAKFQMRDMASIYRKDVVSEINNEDLGSQYTMDLLARFQLSDDDLYRAFDHCRRRNILPLCTPWDETSLLKLNAYGLEAFKVASADFTNHDLLERATHIKKPVICSTGMTSELELRNSIALLKKSACPYVLLHCNSTYPTPDKDINLSYLKRLALLADSPIGYSGHERGFSVPIAAVALGARVIEKHFTTDRSLEGNDHKVSLLPNEFDSMVRGIRQIEQAMGSDGDRFVSQGELMNREILAKSLSAKEEIPAGRQITEKMIEVKGPGHGLQPDKRAELIGKTLKRTKKKGEFFYQSDLDGVAPIARNFQFPHKWGIPVRYHDMQKLRQMSNVDLLEIHLSYRDVKLDFREFITEELDLDLVVHAPELFEGDHTLDLCSSDPTYRQRSIDELQRVIELTSELSVFFKKSSRPKIVTNVGGFSSSSPRPLAERHHLYDVVQRSLEDISSESVEIIPQTMPPFPWHFGGQKYHNLFVDAEEINEFCKQSGVRICLDTSHSKLACEHASKSMHSFMEIVAPHAAHYHLADAAGIDGEGLQIGTGTIDWKEVLKLMSSLSPDASFIPEVWQGHKNDGEGAWLALDRLETIVNELHGSGEV